VFRRLTEIQVEAFLKAHGEDDEGLKGEQKKVATGEWRAGSQYARGSKEGSGWPADPHAPDLLSAEPMRG
jgi:hypothetical protein